MDNNWVQGEFQNLLYGSTNGQSLFNLPINDFVEATKLSLEAQEPRPDGMTIQSTDRCHTLNRSDITSKAIPETSCQAPMNPPHTTFEPPAQANVPGLDGQAAFYNASTSASGIANHVPNSTNQAQGGPSQSHATKRSFAAVDQPNTIATESQGIHTEGPVAGGLDSNSLLTQVFQPPGKRQRHFATKSKGKPKKKEVQESETKFRNEADQVPRPTSVIPAPPSNGSGQRSLDREAARNRTESSTIYPIHSRSGSSALHPHPYVPPNEAGLQMIALKKLEIDIHAALVYMHSYMLKVLDAKYTFETPNVPADPTRTTTNPRMKEAMCLLICVQRQFLEELKDHFGIHQEGVPLPSLLAKGELHDVIGRQQCVLGMAMYPDILSRILRREIQNPYESLIYPKWILLATKRAWLFRVNGWWSERRERFDSAFRQARNRFMGYGLPDGHFGDPYPGRYNALGSVFTGPTGNVHP